MHKTDYACSSLLKMEVLHPCIVFHLYMMDFPYEWFYIKPDYSKSSVKNKTKCRKKECTIKSSLHMTIVCII